MPETQARAPQGGALGANGEFYKGGKFINTVPKNRKGSGSRRTSRPHKVQIEPFVWVIAEDGRKPLFSMVGTCAQYIDGKLCPYLPFVEGAYCDRTLAEVQVACDRFNAGERWES